LVIYGIKSFFGYVALIGGDIKVTLDFRGGGHCNKQKLYKFFVGMAGKSFGNIGHD
jgi:hypothetical protein